MDEMALDESTISELEGCGETSSLGETSSGWGSSVDDDDSDSEVASDDAMLTEAPISTEYFRSELLKRAFDPHYQPQPPPAEIILPPLDEPEMNVTEASVFGLGVIDADRAEAHTDPLADNALLQPSIQENTEGLETDLWAMGHDRPSLWPHFGRRNDRQSYPYAYYREKEESFAAEVQMSQEEEADFIADMEQFPMLSLVEEPEEVNLITATPTIEVGKDSHPDRSLPPIPVPIAPENPPTTTPDPLPSNLEKPAHSKEGTKVVRKVAPLPSGLVDYMNTPTLAPCLAAAARPSNDKERKLTTTAKAVVHRIFVNDERLALAPPKEHFIQQAPDCKESTVPKSPTGRHDHSLPATPTKRPDIPTLPFLVGSAFDQKEAEPQTETQSDLANGKPEDKQNEAIVHKHKVPSLVHKEETAYESAVIPKKFDLPQEASSLLQENAIDASEDVHNKASTTHNLLQKFPAVQRRQQHLPRENQGLVPSSTLYVASDDPESLGYQEFDIAAIEPRELHTPPPAPAEHVSSPRVVFVPIPNAPTQPRLGAISSIEMLPDLTLYAMVSPAGFRSRGESHPELLPSPAVTPSDSLNSESSVFVPEIPQLPPEPDFLENLMDEQNALYRDSDGSLVRHPALNDPIHLQLEEDQHSVLPVDTLPVAELSEIPYLCQETAFSETGSDDISEPFERPTSYHDGTSLRHTFAFSQALTDPNHTDPIDTITVAKLNGVPPAPKESGFVKRESDALDSSEMPLSAFSCFNLFESVQEPFVHSDTDIRCSQPHQKMNRKPINLSQPEEAILSLLSDTDKFSDTEKSSAPLAPTKRLDEIIPQEHEKSSENEAVLEQSSFRLDPRYPMRAAAPKRLTDEEVDPEENIKAEAAVVTYTPEEEPTVCSDDVRSKFLGPVKSRPDVCTIDETFLDRTVETDLEAGDSSTATASTAPNPPQDLYEITSIDNDFVPDATVKPMIATLHAALLDPGADEAEATSENLACLLRPEVDDFDFVPNPVSTFSIQADDEEDPTVCLVALQKTATAMLLALGPEVVLASEDKMIEDLNTRATEIHVPSPDLIVLNLRASDLENIERASDPSALVSCWLSSIKSEPTASEANDQCDAVLSSSQPTSILALTALPSIVESHDMQEIASTSSLANILPSLPSEINAIDEDPLPAFAIQSWMLALEAKVTDPEADEVEALSQSLSTLVPVEDFAFKPCPAARSLVLIDNEADPIESMLSIESALAKAPPGIATETILSFNDSALEAMTKEMVTMDVLQPHDVALDLNTDYRFNNNFQEDSSLAATSWDRIQAEEPPVALSSESADEDSYQASQTEPLKMFQIKALPALIEREGDPQYCQGVPTTMMEVPSEITENALVDKDYLSLEATQSDAVLSVPEVDNPDAVLVEKSVNESIMLCLNESMSFMARPEVVSAFNPNSAALPPALLDMQMDPIEYSRALGKPVYMSTLSLDILTASADQMDDTARVAPLPIVGIPLPCEVEVSLAIDTPETKASEKPTLWSGESISAEPVLDWNSDELDSQRQPAPISLLSDPEQALPKLLEEPTRDSVPCCTQACPVYAPCASLDNVDTLDDDYIPVPAKQSQVVALEAIPVDAVTYETEALSASNSNSAPPDTFGVVTSTVPASPVLIDEEVDPSDFLLEVQVQNTSALISSLATETTLAVKDQDSSIVGPIPMVRIVPEPLDIVLDLSPECEEASCATESDPNAVAIPWSSVEKEPTVSKANDPCVQYVPPVLSSPVPDIGECIPASAESEDIQRDAPALTPSMAVPSIGPDVVIADFDFLPPSAKQSLILQLKAAVGEPELVDIEVFCASMSSLQQCETSRMVPNSLATEAVLLEDDDAKNDSRKHSLPLEESAVPPLGKEVKVGCNDKEINRLDPVSVVRKIVEPRSLELDLVPELSQGFETHTDPIAVVSSWNNVEVEPTMSHRRNDEDLLNVLPIMSSMVSSLEEYRVVESEVIYDALALEITSMPQPPEPLDIVIWETDSMPTQSQQSPNVLLEAVLKDPEAIDAEVMTSESGEPCLTRSATLLFVPQSVLCAPLLSDDECDPVEVLRGANEADTLFLPVLALEAILAKDDKMLMKADTYIQCVQLPEPKVVVVQEVAPNVEATEKPITSSLPDVPELSIVREAVNTDSEPASATRSPIFVLEAMVRDSETDQDEEISESMTKLSRPEDEFGFQPIRITVHCSILDDDPDPFEGLLLLDHQLSSLVPVLGPEITVCFDTETTHGSLEPVTRVVTIPEPASLAVEEELSAEYNQAPEIQADLIATASPLSVVETEPKKNIAPSTLEAEPRWKSPSSNEFPMVLVLPVGQPLLPELIYRSPVDESDLGEHDTRMSLLYDNDMPSTPREVICIQEDSKPSCAMQSLGVVLEAFLLDVEPLAIEEMTKSASSLTRPDTLNFAPLFVPSPYTLVDTDADPVYDAMQRKIDEARASVPTLGSEIPVKSNDKMCAPLQQAMQVTGLSEPMEVMLETEPDYESADQTSADPNAAVSVWDGFDNEPMLKGGLVLNECFFEIIPVSLSIVPGPIESLLESGDFESDSVKPSQFVCIGEAIREFALVAAPIPVMNEREASVPIPLESKIALKSIEVQDCSVDIVPAPEEPKLKYFDSQREQEPPFPKPCTVEALTDIYEYEDFSTEYVESLLGSRPESMPFLPEHPAEIKIVMPAPGLPTDPHLLDYSGDPIEMRDNQVQPIIPQLPSELRILKLPPRPPLPLLRRPPLLADITNDPMQKVDKQIRPALVTHPNELKICRGPPTVRRPPLLIDYANDPAEKDRQKIAKMVSLPSELRIFRAPPIVRSSSKPLLLDARNEEPIDKLFASIKPQVPSHPWELHIMIQPPQRPLQHGRAATAAQEARRTETQQHQVRAY